MVKRYSREPGSSLVRKLLSTSDPVATSRLSEIEIASAVARREREGAFTSGARNRILAALDADLAAVVIVELIPSVCAGARGLLQRHALRASDAAQLASCLYLREQIGQAVTFVTFDDRLARAAGNERLEVQPVRTERR